MDHSTPSTAPYFQFVLPIEDQFLQEQVLAELADQGFEGFEQQEKQLLAFLQQSEFTPERQAFLEQITQRLKIPFDTVAIEPENWNASWEKSFEPVVIDQYCAIRAHFHEPIRHVKHELVITPKMSFGTGHHATTSMMIQQMKGLTLQDKTVFDFGTGTGVLAILAEKEGAHSVLAIDNDPWSIENAQENIARNQCTRIQLKLQDQINPTSKFDVVLANINRHVIENQLKELVQSVQPDGLLLLSGLLHTDQQDIVKLLEQENFKLRKQLHEKQWISLLFSR